MEITRTHANMGIYTILSVNDNDMLGMSLFQSKSVLLNQDVSHSEHRSM